MRRLAVTGSLFATLALLAAAVGTSAAPLAQAPPTLNLIAGQGDGVISMNGFIADLALGGTTARVAVGTTVAWTVGSDEQHTITFLAGKPIPPLVVPQPEDPAGRPPMLNPDFFTPAPATGAWDGATFNNSGAIGRSQQFTVTFGKEGRYPYVCLFHEPAMAGTIEVAAAGSAGITTQGAVDQLAATHMAAVHDRQIAQIFAQRNTADVSEGPNGRSVWSIRAGTDWRQGHLDVLAFLSDTLTIAQGDTVAWYVDHPVPHTVTFSDPGVPRPELVVPTLPDGTPLQLPPPGDHPPDIAHPGAIDPSAVRLVLGPGALPARDNPTHVGSGLYNSGIIGSHGNLALGSNTWSLTFAEPGEYEYVCLIHEPLGMVGKVTVLPR